MALLGNVRRFLSSLLNKQSSSLTWAYGNREVYIDIDAQKALTEGYLGNTAVYSIVMKDADKFSCIPRYVYANNDEQDTPLDNDLNKLLKRPNEYDSEDSFLKKVRAYYKVTGEAFIWLNRGDVDGLDSATILKRPVLEMYVLPSNLVEVLSDPNDVFGVIGYELCLGSSSEFIIPKECMLHWKQPNLDFNVSTRSHLRGYSPLSSGYKSLTQDNATTDALVRMHQNDGAKGVLFNENLQDLDPAQQDQVRGVVNKRINNGDVKGAVATLQGKWGYLDITSSIDPKLIESKKLSWQELCFLLKVPYELFDPQTTYANKQEAQKGWITNDIIPACEDFDGMLNKTLLIAFGLDKTAHIESDYTDLPELQEDMAKKVQALMQAWPITPDEIREQLGYEPLGGTFAEPWVPSGLTPLSQQSDGFDQMAQQLRQQGLNDTTGD